MKPLDPRPNDPQLPWATPSSERAAGVRAADRAVVDRCRASALWAAYGDALGFISELASEDTLLKRAGVAELRETVAWQRRVGGRSGVLVRLPAGCYSDDTQLRLATSRAIGPLGFDVEAFARVELPVWLAYALGGGRSTKAAAAGLSKTGVAWYSNSYRGWAEAGGNGVAMRVQPHVWASFGLQRDGDFLLEVMRNGVTTHGHPVGLVGALLHARLLHSAVLTGGVPAQAEVKEAIFSLGAAVEDYRNVEGLDLWFGMWDRAGSRPLGVAWHEAIAGAAAALDSIGKIKMPVSGPPGWYQQVLRTLSLRDPANRGSATLTALAAWGLASVADGPDQAVRISANALHSDTDTVGTMAGALLGAASGLGSTPSLMDTHVIDSETKRLLGTGSVRTAYPYPDLLHWVAPQTQADAVFKDGDDGLYVAGLGPARPLDDPVWDSAQRFGWQWAELSHGQTVLIKRRRELDLVEEHQRTLAVPSLNANVGDMELATAGDAKAHSLESWDAAAFGDPDRQEHREQRELELSRVLAFLEHEEYSNYAIGYAIKRVAARGTADQWVLFQSVLLERLRNRPEPLA